MPEYVNANHERGRELEEEAELQFAEAKDAIRTSDFYVLLTVLFASVLFFAGICTKFKTPWISIAVLSMGAVVFVISLVIMIMQPIM
jgi:ABC-type multidrug transport system fused ATPase/permease subunit